MATTAIDTIEKELRPQLLKLQDTFVKSKNMFLADDDQKVVKKYLARCDRHIEEVFVKAQNAQKLL
jgi:ribosome-associated translation inhibitor RaiA